MSRATPKLKYSWNYKFFWFHERKNEEKRLKRVFHLFRGKIRCRFHDEKRARLIFAIYIKALCRCHGKSQIQFHDFYWMSERCGVERNELFRRGFSVAMTSQAKSALSTTRWMHDKLFSPHYRMDQQFSGKISHPGFEHNARRSLHHRSLLHVQQLNLCWLR